MNDKKPKFNIPETSVSLDDNPMFLKRYVLSESEIMILIFFFNIRDIFLLIFSAIVDAESNGDAQ